MWTHQQGEAIKNREDALAKISEQEQEQQTCKLLAELPDVSKLEDPSCFESERPLMVQAA